MRRSCDLAAAALSQPPIRSLQIARDRIVSKRSHICADRGSRREPPGASHWCGIGHCRYGAVELGNFGLDWEAISPNVGGLQLLLPRTAVASPEWKLALCWRKVLLNGCAASAGSGMRFANRNCRDLPAKASVSARAPSYAKLLRSFAKFCLAAEVESHSSILEM